MKRNNLSVENVYFDILNEHMPYRNTYLRLLNGVSVNFKSGRLTAIMGTNRSGKSTLVNLIMGKVEKESKTSGRITYNGDEDRDPAVWTEKIAFLEQKEDYIKSLTVEEYLRYELRFYRKDLNDEQQKSLLFEVMSKAEIIHKRREIIQDLSGDEITKTMISDVLLQDAEIIFMDEPTSWLDSSNALTFIQYMKEVAAQRNIIVAIIINQASQEIFNLFDDMIFIKPGGNLFYSGPVSKVDEFLEEKSFKRDEGVPTHFYLYLLLSVTSDINIPVAGSTFNNTIKSSVKVYSDLNKIYTGKGFSFTDVFTILKRRLAYGYGENEFRVLFFVKILLCLVISFFSEMFVDDVNKNVIQQIKINNDEQNSAAFAFSLKALLMHSRTLCFYLGIHNCFSHLVTPRFFEKKEILTNEIFHGKYSTISLYVSSLVYDFAFRLSSTCCLSSFLLLYQSQYMLHPWILSLTITSLWFSVILHSFISTVQRKYIYIPVVIIIYTMFIFIPDFAILQLFVKNRENKSLLGLILSRLLLSTLVINPTNWLKLVWYKAIYNNEAYERIFKQFRRHVSNLRDNVTVIDTLLIDNRDIKKSFLGYSNCDLWLFMAFGFISLSYIGIIYFLFARNVSPTIRLKLKK